jgi:hypothetical protein
MTSKDFKIHITDWTKDDIMDKFKDFNVRVKNNVEKLKNYPNSLIVDLIPTQTEGKRETDKTYLIKYKDEDEKQKICELLNIKCSKKTYTHYPKPLEKGDIKYWKVKNEDDFKVKYPIFIVSKGRDLSLKKTMTWDILDELGLDYKIVVEQNQQYYKDRFGDKVLFITDKYQNDKDIDFSVRQRSFIVDYCNENGINSHWDMDDNIFQFSYHNRLQDKKIISKVPLHYIEYIHDKYNFSMSGFSEFGKNLPVRSQETREKNMFSRVFSCMLINNKNLKEKGLNFIGKYNEDLVLNLNCLTNGLNIYRTHQFKIGKPTTSNTDKRKSMIGGNSEVHKEGGIERRVKYVCEKFPKYVKECKRNSKSYDVHFEVNYKHKDFKHDIKNYNIPKDERNKNNYSYVDFYEFEPYH